MDPTPSNVLQGHSICRVCAGRDTYATEVRFRAVLKEQGAELLEPYWLGSHRRHRIRCAVGHVVSPLPTNVLMGHGICRACAGRDPVNSEAKFRARLAELGTELLEHEWLGHHKAHRARCAEGHSCFPRPTDVMRGHSPCLTCVGQDPETNLRKFRILLAERGAILLETGWLGSSRPHRVRCQAGHICTPRPGDIASGSGVCRFCAGSSWDVFYVVGDTTNYRIKFGVTSGDPKCRLTAHRRDGYVQVLRLLTDLPGTVAHDIERAVRTVLKLAKVLPIRGREYFDSAATGVVLDIVDHYPIPTSPVPLSKLLNDKPDGP